MRDQFNTFAYLSWHALAASVDPVDPDVVWIGGLDVWRSVDAGDNWQQMTFWAPGSEEQGARYVHADIHQIMFWPGNPSSMYIATDGGVFESNQAQSDSPVFNERNFQYNTLQYYSCAIHPEAGTDYYLGGLQDNGTLMYLPGEVPNRNFRISGGDGAYCFIDKNEPNIQYTTIYYTWISAFDIDPQDHFRGIHGQNFNIGTFINPMDYDYQYNVIYANGAHFTGFNANTIGVIRLVGDRLSGGLKDVPTNINVPFSAIKWYEESGDNASTIYMGSESGQLFRLTDAVIIGDLTELTGDDFPAAYISSIDIGPAEDTLLVTFSNYGVPSVWVTANGGDDWLNVDTNLPDMPVRWGILHPMNSKQVMLATETGVWTTMDAFAQNVVWTPATDGMGNVRVDMLQVRSADNTVLAASHGRGLFTTGWDASFISGTESVETAIDIKAYPNPSQGLFTVDLPAGLEGHMEILDIQGRLV